jgi:hypothetical protein
MVNLKWRCMIRDGAVVEEVGNIERLKVLVEFGGEGWKHLHACSGVCMTK